MAKGPQEMDYRDDGARVRGVRPRHVKIPPDLVGDRKEERDGVSKSERDGRGEEGRGTRATKGERDGRSDSLTGQSTPGTYVCVKSSAARRRGYSVFATGKLTYIIADDAFECGQGNGIADDGPNDFVYVPFPHSSRLICI